MGFALSDVCASVSEPMNLFKVLDVIAAGIIL